MTLLFGVSFFSYAQTSVSGVVLDSLSNPISDAIVTLYKDSKYSSFLNFKTTDSNGNFKLSFTNKKDTLFVDVRHISFKTKRLKITDSQEKLKIRLQSNSNKLDEVLINAKKSITIKGDTVRYDVEALKEKKDYTIEEVIDRIPGIKIAENGQISYNDRPISHLYINGVDLLEGRYNIATRGIPADAVEDIELLRRHNHARIDIGKTLSSEVALNLKIKKDQSLVFGSSKADAGIPFLTARGEATPIYLKDKLQNIGSIRANNIGQSLLDYGEDLVRGNREINQLKINRSTIINEPDITGNTISNRYWLDNTSFSVTNDILSTINKDVIVKGSVDYNIDESEIEKNSESVYFNNNDSLFVNTNSKNKLLKRRYQIGSTIELNRDDLYLKNKISGRHLNQDGLSFNSINDNDINSNFNNTSTSFTNILELKNSINDQVLDSGLLVEYLNNNEELRTNPAVFNSIIPSNSTNLTIQEAAINKLNIAAYSGYNFNLFNIDWNGKQRIKWSNEQLISTLKSQEDETVLSPFKTDFSINTFESFSSISSAFDLGKFRINLNPQIIYYNLKRKEILTDEINNNEYFFPNGNIQISRSFKRKWDFSLGGSLRNSISQFEDIYPGIILTRFDNLNRNPENINVVSETEYFLFLGYNDVLSGIFLKNNFSFNNSTSDFIFNRTLDANGLIQINAIRKDNDFSTLRNTFTLTKRFFKHLNTQTSYDFSRSKIEQIFNGISQENTILFHSLNTELSWNSSEYYSISYSGSINFGSTLVDNFKATNNFQLHQLSLDFYLSDKTRWNISSETAISSFSGNDNTNFNSLFNTSVYYKPHKKLILRGQIYNIFNERFFTTSTSSSNFINLNQFSLRPFQFTLGLNYTL